jgi:hypothetical protein
VPTRYLDDETPVVQFDPQLEVSPFALFRRLKEGDSPLLVDLREEAGEYTLTGALPDPGSAWEPPDDRDTVLFDQDGSLAVARARTFQAEGFERVRALFGGIDLYRFSLDPQVVGAETFLVPAPHPGRRNASSGS